MGPPATCSISLGTATLDVRAAAGSASPAVMQVITNTGSLDLAGVAINATPWHAGPSGAAPPHGPGGHAPLPPSLTELSTVGPAAPRSFAPLSADGAGPPGAAPLAAGLPPDGERPLWFRINLDGAAGSPPDGGLLVQRVEYIAECAAPPLPPP